MIPEYRVQITEVQLSKYKTLRKLNAQTQTINVLTGQNNAGKSYIFERLSSFGCGDELCQTSIAICGGKHLSDVDMDILFLRRIYLSPWRDIHTDLELVETTVDFTFDNDAILTLYFPVDGGFIFFVQGSCPPKSPTAFKSTFPFQLIQVPVLVHLKIKNP